MSENRQEKPQKKEQIVKVIKDEFSYKPGPLMEEKIIRTIRRRKMRRFIYKIGLIVTLSVFLLLFKTEGININFKVFERTFSLKFSSKENSFNLFNNSIHENERASQKIENDESPDSSDHFFEMLKYAVIASDGDW
jgi:hypothetical protein